MGLEGLLTGHLLCDRYRVERVVGSGGMGAVYCATDIRLEREVAVKVITVATGDVASRARLRSRFHREARAAARLQHPNVVTVFDFGTDARLDLDFLVMELLRGEDMATRLQRAGTCEVAAGLEIVEQAARGVAAGHQAGLVHRDIKPGNLFVVDGGPGRLRVCVLDFGIVQLSVDDGEGDATATHLTVAGRAPHSPAYAAPEQLRGDPQLSPACDVWGLGATAFQMLTGERPFTDAEQRRMMDGMPVPAPSARARNPRVPETVDDVIRIALAYRPADRFRDAAAFANAVAGLRGPVLEPAGAAFHPRPEPVPSPARDEMDDRTLLVPEPDRARAVPIGWWKRAGRAPAPALEPTRGETLLDPVLAERDRPTASAGTARPPWAAQTEMAQASIPSPLPPPRRRWYRRATAALWQLTITLAAAGIAAAFGVGMMESFVNNLTESFYASLTGLTLALPWAVHRVFGRRGSYLAAVLGCVAVAVAVFRFLAPLTGAETAVIMLAPAQFVTAAWISRVTRRTSVVQDERTVLSPSISL